MDGSAMRPPSLKSIVAWEGWSDGTSNYSFLPIPRYPLYPPNTGILRYPLFDVRANLFKLIGISGSKAESLTQVSPLAGSKGSKTVTMKQKILFECRKNIPY